MMVNCQLSKSKSMPTSTSKPMPPSNIKVKFKVFPNIQIKGEIGKNKTLLSNDKAKKILGFKPEYSWKNIN